MAYLDIQLTLIRWARLYRFSGLRVEDQLNICHLCAKVRKSHARAHASKIYLWGALQAKLSRQNAFPSLFEWARHEAQGLDGLRSVPDPV